MVIFSSPLDRFRLRPYGPGLGLTLAFATMLVACGGDPPSNEKFTFHEGDPGTHVGAHVTVEIDGEEFHSNEFEVLLESSGDIDDVDRYVDDEELQEHTSGLAIADGENKDHPSHSNRLMPSPAAADTLADDPDYIQERFEASKELLSASESSPLVDMLKSSQRLDDCDGGPELARNYGDTAILGTFDGWSCWAKTTGTVTQANYSQSYNWVTFLAPEGNYFALAEGRGLGLPITGLTFAGSWGYSFGCAYAGEDTIPISFHDGELFTPSISYTMMTFPMPMIGGISVGRSIGFGVPMIGPRPVGFEVTDNPVSLSFDFMSFISLPWSLSWPQDGPGIVSGPFPVGGWDEQCMDDPDRSPNDPFEELAERTTSDDDTPTFANQSEPPPPQANDGNDGEDNQDDGEDNQDDGEDNQDDGEDNQDDGEDNQDDGEDNQDDGEDNQDDETPPELPPELSCEDYEELDDDDPLKEEYADAYEEECNDADGMNLLVDASDYGAVAIHNLDGSSAVSALMGPYFTWLNTPSGVGSADHIPAGSHADWYAEWFAAGDPSECSDCSNMSINHLTETTADMMVSAADGADEIGLMKAGLWGAQQYVRSAPEFANHQVMTEGIDAAVQASFNDVLTQRAQMVDDPTLHYSEKTLEYAVRAGETVDLPVMARELADLLDATEDDVQGAEICITTFRDSDDVCGTLDGDSLTFNYTPDDPNPIIFTIDVDLSDADGFSDVEDIEEWSVQPARRLITPLVDTPVASALSGPNIVTSGSPVTLNAQLIDENARLVEKPATFRFYDAHGELLAEVESDNGRARHQFIPEPVAPVVDDVEQVTINYDSGDDGIGYVIYGERMSHAADILVDGQKLSEDDVLIQYEEPGAIIIGPRENIDEPLFDSGQSFEVVNPGDLSDSHTASF